MVNFKSETDPPSKEVSLGAGEMASWLRAVLAETLDLIPSTSVVAQICNSDSEGSDTQFWALQELGAHMVHRHMCNQNTNA